MAIDLEELCRAIVTDNRFPRDYWVMIDDGLGGVTIQSKNVAFCITRQYADDCGIPVSVNRVINIIDNIGEIKQAVGWHDGIA